MPNQIRTALITGASAGLGVEFARRLAADGFRLILAARRIDLLHRLSDELKSTHGAEVMVFACDLSTDQGWMGLCESVDRVGWPVDTLINNAGFGTHGAFHTSDTQSQSDMIHVNTLALTMLTRHFIGGMLERRRGAVLNVASVAAFQPGPLMSVYFATKAYVLSFSEALHEELRGTGIHVTALCPGPTESEFMAVSGMDSSRLIKGRRLPTAADVVALGIAALNAGRRSVIHGTGNRILARLATWFPRVLVLRTTHYLQKKA
ncbi:MAG: SDR family NAD(P)-dependent oxidoreductase [Bacteroidota bacterium]